MCVGEQSGAISLGFCGRERFFGLSCTDKLSLEFRRVLTAFGDERSQFHFHSAFPV
jgi:hypothetical protein